MTVPSSRGASMPLEGGSASSAVTATAGGSWMCPPLAVLSHLGTEAAASPRGPPRDTRWRVSSHSPCRPKTGNGAPGPRVQTLRLDIDGDARTGSGGMCTSAAGTQHHRGMGMLPTYDDDPAPGRKWGKCTRTSALWPRTLHADTGAGSTATVAMGTPPGSPVRAILAYPITEPPEAELEARGAQPGSGGGGGGGDDAAPRGAWGAGSMGRDDMDSGDEGRKSPMGPALKRASRSAKNGGSSSNGDGEDRAGLLTAGTGPARGEKATS